MQDFNNLKVWQKTRQQYHLLLSRDLNYIDGKSRETLDGQTSEIKRMLIALIK
jgi:hypothetical protein